MSESDSFTSNQRSLIKQLRQPSHKIAWTGRGGLMSLAADEIERLSAALTEARDIFTQLGYAEDDKVSNTASRGVYVTAKALADSTAAAPESRDG